MLQDFKPLFSQPSKLWWHKSASLDSKSNRWTILRINVDHLARMCDWQPFLGSPYMFFARSCPTSRSRANLRLQQLDVCKSSSYLHTVIWSPLEYLHKHKTMVDGEPGHEKKEIGGRCLASNWERNASCFVKRHMELHCEGTRTAPKTCATAQPSVISTSQAALRKGWIDPK